MEVKLKALKNVIKLRCPRCNSKNYKAYRVYCANGEIRYIRGCFRCCWTEKWNRGYKLYVK